MPRCRKKTELSLTDTLQAMRTQTGLRTGARSDATHLLLKREEMLSKVFRLIPDMVVVTELTTGTILDVNDRYCEVMGYRRDELIGSSSLALHNWVCPDDRKAFTDALLRNTTCSSFRTTLCTKSGTRMPVTITARLLDLDGTTCIVSIVRDITELHQKEQALEYRIALERLVATISTHVLGLRASDIDAGIEYGLERIGTFAGADRCTLWQCLPDGSRMDATHEWCAADVPSLLRRRSSIRLRDELPALMQCIRNSAPYRLDLPLPTDIGHDHDTAFFRSYRTVSVVAVPMPYPGQPTLVLCCEKTKDTACWPADLPALLKIASEIFMNALIRARNERELRDSEQRFRSLFDNAQDGMVVVDPET
ncbi:MAG: PAS domain S-box protein, partial [Desulfobacterota bacterium]|nr:PAS domain S-box protein [Thermodesulfobacteriota bacterium]